MSTAVPSWVRAAPVADVEALGRLVVHVNGHSILLVSSGERMYAVDNRCPHMGFPLHRGTIGDGILTCHWHHARFDLSTGGTFDPWADDVPSFPVEVRDGEVWVSVGSGSHGRDHHRGRLGDGLYHNIPLVIAKACVWLTEDRPDAVDPFRMGVAFGVRNRKAGWGQGLTMHTCMMNLLPYLEVGDRPRALFHGLSAVARDTLGQAPRSPIHPLPGSFGDLVRLKRWFRRFVEVRDAEGAERVIVTALQSGAGREEVADLLFSAATDHRYLAVGHVLDFTNKALEALDHLGWQGAKEVLASLPAGYAGAARMEESNAWRHPLDLVSILEEAFDRLPEALSRPREAASPATPDGELTSLLLGEDPKDTVEAMLVCLQEGMSPEELAGAVSYAAALRIARFHLSNDFSDWDTALHTFTFANAVGQGLRRTRSPELVRGVFDAAMSVYLDRFLNIPAVPLPDPHPDLNPEGTPEPVALLKELPALLDGRGQVNESARLVASYLGTGGDANRLLAILGKLLLREDRDFHTIQTVEAAFRQFERLRGKAEGAHVLVAAVRYLAAHAPTHRTQGQTFQIAQRLDRGERLYEEGDV